MKNIVKQSFKRLENYCEEQDFKGWDPYDGLNSSFFQALPIISKNRFCRLAWIQLFKRNPINLRALFGVDKGYNAKGIGLFLHSYCNLYKIEPRQEYKDKIVQLADIVVGLRSKGYSGSCWGYNFDWQARAFFQPKGTPTVVATTFIATALIEAFKITSNQFYLDVAIDSANFILKDLNRTYDDNGNFAFSYSPLDQTQVFNASLLGSRLLSQIYIYTQDDNLLVAAKKSVEFCCNFQQESGAWAYGTLPFHYWVDNFHTGYNLECIDAYQRASGDLSYKAHLDKGLEYYLNNFFTEEGIPKYYNNKTYPVDIHTTAQLVITLSRMGIWKENKALIDKVMNWTINNMQDKKGYFYYQLKKRMNTKIPYIRWAQSWMFYAQSEYLLQEKIKL